MTTATAAPAPAPLPRGFGEYARRQIDQFPPHIAAQRIAHQHDEALQEIDGRLTAASDETRHALSNASLRHHMLQGMSHTLQLEVERRLEAEAYLRQAEHILGLAKGLATAGGNVPAADLAGILDQVVDRPPFRPLLTWWVSSQVHAYGHFTDREGREGLVYPFAGWGHVIVAPGVDPLCEEPVFSVNGDLYPRITLELDQGWTLNHLT